MRTRVKRLLVAACLALSLSSAWVLTTNVTVAQEGQPITPAQLQKILKFVDAIGAKEEFPAPTAQNLGVSGDPNLALPVIVVVTNDHKVYFCRSELNPTDYIIWVRTGDKDSSYMFLTHPDLKLVRALQLRTNGFPDVLTSPPAQVQAMYKDALLALGKDVDQSH
jgi:hypothetical protein